jgi:hypothetical protein
MTTVKNPITALGRCSSVFFRSSTQVKSAAEVCKFVVYPKFASKISKKEKQEKIARNGNCLSKEYSRKSKNFQLPGVLTQISDFLGTKAKPEQRRKR